MPVPNVYGVPVAKVAGDTLGAGEVNSLGLSVNLFAVRLAELLGPGAFRSTDFNGTPVDGELELLVSGGDGLIGAVGEQGLVFQEGDVLVTEVHGIVASDTNYFYLDRDGAWTVVQDTGDAPPNSSLMISAVFDASEATSVDNDPEGRNTILPFPSDGLILSSEDDTVRKLLIEALVNGTGITITEENDGGGGKRLRIACTVTADDHKVMVQAADTAKYLYDCIRLAPGSGLTKAIYDPETPGSPAGNVLLELGWSSPGGEPFTLADLDSYALTCPAGEQRSVKVVLGKGSFASGSKYTVNVSHAHAKDKVKVLVDATKTGSEFWVLVQNAADSGLSTITLDFLVYGYDWTAAGGSPAEVFTAYAFNFPVVPEDAGGGPYGTTVAFPACTWRVEASALQTTYTQAGNTWADGAIIAWLAPYDGEARAVVARALDGSAADVQWTLFKNGIETGLYATTEAVNGEGIGIASDGLIPFVQYDRLELRPKKLTTPIRSHGQMAELLVRYN
jgi:hypothetical protein